MDTNFNKIIKMNLEWGYTLEDATAYALLDKHKINEFIADPSDPDYKPNLHIFSGQKETRIINAIKEFHTIQKQEFLKEFFKITSEYKTDENETKTRRLQLLIKPSLYNLINELATTTNTSINELIEIAITKAIKNNKTSIKGQKWTTKTTNKTQNI